MRQNADDHLASETIFSTHDLGGLSVALVKGTKKSTFYSSNNTRNHTHMYFLGNT